MTDRGPCRDCSETIQVTPEKLERMLEMLTESRHMELADEETSRKRLSLCMNCSGYTLAGTCKYCGCLVQIRTKLNHRSCPYPWNPKW
ncbi:DUF6171 family protein [Paenibacillus humicola]|uniref:DUF6171 family protein n=1 Tax=Paenibacillus humicola TaxID=3110540 RepID=UPI003B83707E